MNYLGKYEGISERIRQELQNAQSCFIRIGYFLKKVRDEEIFKEKGYKNITEYALEEFGIGQTSAYRFIQMNDKFSVGGNSLEIEDKYAPYDKSKLQEMLNMNSEQLEQVKPEMTVKEIKSIKKVGSIKADKVDWDFEAKVDKATKSRELQRELAKFLVNRYGEYAESEFARSNRSFNKFYKVNNTYFYSVTWAGAFVFFYNAGDVLITKVLKEDFIEDFLKDFATSQKNEDVANDIEDVQIEGQMNIMDYPEAVPEDMEVVEEDKVEVVGISAEERERILEDIKFLQSEIDKNDTYNQLDMKNGDVSKDRIRKRALLTEAYNLLIDKLNNELR